MCDREILLKKISEMQFAAFDLHLYLDSHPNCRCALAQYKKYIAATKQLMNEYEMRYGPLVSGNISDDAECWRWVKDPWPWEISMGGCK